MASTGKVEIIVKGKDEASPALKSVGKSADDMGKKMADAGKVMMVAGVGIVATLGAAAKSAEDERINIARLSATMDNVGVSYDKVKDKLEALILVQSRKTGVADEEQRNALSELILATGDYQTALDLLPLALDFAAAKQTDVSTAAEILGKVAMGNTSILTRYGITLADDATAADALAAIQDKVTGSAEKMASPLSILKNSFDDMTESIGEALLPIMDGLIAKSVAIIDKFSKWAKDNPALIKTLLGIGAVLAAGGAILVGLSQLSKAIISINLALVIMKGLSGPKGWAMLAAGLVIAGGAILAINKMTAQVSEGTSAGVTPPPEGSESDAQQANYNQWSLGHITQAEYMKNYLDIIKKYHPAGYASGGTVPGKLGAPVPIIAHGGEKFLGTQGQGSNGVTVNITNLGSVITERDLLQRIREGLFKVQHRNFSTGIS